MNEQRFVEVHLSNEHYLATLAPDNTVFALEIFCRGLDEMWNEIDLKLLSPKALRILNQAVAKALSEQNSEEAAV